MSKKERKKHTKLWIIILSLLTVLIAALLVFMHFGGFGTGENADPQEFAAQAGTVEDITIPEEATIVALGEATHGNAEFQELKLDVFKHMVESYGVRGFALEGDFGGCEQANRYIHGGAGTAEDAAAAIGFALYRTDEMAELIGYMRQYNETAAEGDDLRFYGFDMQRCTYNIQFLAEVCRGLGIDSSELESLASDDNWNSGYDTSARIDVITRTKAELESAGGSAQALHFADILLQNCQLQTVADVEYGDVRDGLMAQNTLWIAEQERERGFSRIFVSGHNGHVAKYGSYDAMGKLLADELGEGYYAIGTDFYKTNCNLPSGSDGKRTEQVFYSYDPLAKAAKLAGLDICWLDFAKVPQDSALAAWTTGYHYMGSLGEGYSLLMRLLPQSYRIFQPPAGLYDGMIFVSEATPTYIASAA